MISDTGYDVSNLSIKETGRKREKCMSLKAVYISDLYNLEIYAYNIFRIQNFNLFASRFSSDLSHTSCSPSGDATFILWTKK